MRLKVALAVIAVSVGAGWLTLMAAPAASASSTIADTLCNYDPYASSIDGYQFGCVQSLGDYAYTELYEPFSKYATKFTWEPLSGGYAEIEQTSQNECLQAGSSGVIMAPCDGQSSQLWKYEDSFGVDCGGPILPYCLYYYSELQNKWDGDCLEGTETAGFAENLPLAMTGCEAYNGEFFETGSLTADIES